MKAKSSPTSPVPGAPQDNLPGDDLPRDDQDGTDALIAGFFYSWLGLPPPWASPASVDPVGPAGSAPSGFPPGRVPRGAPGLAVRRLAASPLARLYYAAAMAEAMLLPHHMARSRDDQDAQSRRVARVLGLDVAVHEGTVGAYVICWPAGPYPKAPRSVRLLVPGGRRQRGRVLGGLEAHLRALVERLKGPQAKGPRPGGAGRAPRGAPPLPAKWSPQGARRGADTPGERAPLIFSVRVGSPYEDFCNSAPRGFRLGGLRWRSVTGFLLARMAPGTHAAEAIRLAATADEARRLAREAGLESPADWERVRAEWLDVALLAKFRAHPGLRALLLATGARALVEEPPKSFPAPGGPLVTRNTLGFALMRVRSTLRRSAAQKHSAARRRSAAAGAPSP